MNGSWCQRERKHGVATGTKVGIGTKSDYLLAIETYVVGAASPQDEQQLQRRCYWLLEGDDDVVLVHYLMVDLHQNRPRPAPTPPGVQPMQVVLALTGFPVMDKRYRYGLVVVLLPNALNSSS